MMQLSKTLICRYHKQLVPRLIRLKLDEKEWIYQVLTVGHHLSPHGDKFGLLYVRKRSITAISISISGTGVLTLSFNPTPGTACLAIGSLSVRCKLPDT